MLPESLTEAPTTNMHQQSLETAHCPPPASEVFYGSLDHCDTEMTDVRVTSKQRVQHGTHRDYGLALLHFLLLHATRHSASWTP